MPEWYHPVGIGGRHALKHRTRLPGLIGAQSNRLESTIADLQTTTEKLGAGRSRIQDADFAEETCRLTHAQILQQAGSAMPTQANAQPNVVSLLLR